MVIPFHSRILENDKYLRLCMGVARNSVMLNRTTTDIVPNNLEEYAYTDGII